jgi:hypothetical protein
VGHQGRTSFSISMIHADASSAYPFFLYSCRSKSRGVMDKYTAVQALRQPDLSSCREPCVLVVGASGAVFGLQGFFIADLIVNPRDDYWPSCFASQ